MNGACLILVNYATTNWNDKNYKPKLYKGSCETSFKKNSNFKTPFYGWGSTASRLESLRGGSLLFTTKFPEIPGTHFIDLGGMNG